MVNLSNDNKTEETSIVAKILGILWQRIFIVFIAVALALVAFLGYVKIKKPDYTAYEKVNYVVRNTVVEDDEERKSTAHINSEQKYASTVADFFATGNVVNRANFYYNQFDKIMNEKYSSGYDFDTREVELKRFTYAVNGIHVTDRILNDCKVKEGSSLKESRFNVFLKNNTTENPDYQNVSFVDKKDNLYRFRSSNGDVLYKVSKDNIGYIVFSLEIEDYVDSKKYGDNIKRTNVDVSYDEEEVGYVFTVSYIDYSNIDADEKVKMVVLAANQEIKVKVDDEYVYFKTLQVDLEDFGKDGPVIMNVSRKKMLVIFCAVGVIVGIIAVYLSTLIEKSVTSRKELEAITGVPLLAHIESIKENEAR